MSEYWKSTPKYWCKHCGVFVRDTKLERQNHEATGRHQGALKRSLRELHRGHEREERDKDRARREIERLNGVVTGSSSGAAASSSSSSAAGGPAAPPPKATATQMARQREQLAELGVAMPSEFRADMAMPGDWSVTSTRVVESNPGVGPSEEDSKDRVEAKAAGVRKREVTEEQREEEEAVKGLFKKRKRWGATKTMPEEDEELDALLSGNTFSAPAAKTEAETQEGDVKREEGETREGEEEDPSLWVKGEEAEVKVKAEPRDDPDEDPGDAVKAPDLTATDTAVKAEKDAEEDASTAAPAPVMFKKRKPKGIRQK